MFVVQTFKFPQHFAVSFSLQSLACDTIMKLTLDAKFVETCMTLNGF
jgi:hypothetical protein